MNEFNASALDRFNRCLQHLWHEFTKQLGSHVPFGK